MNRFLVWVLFSLLASAVFYCALRVVAIVGMR